jgi:hypothetical protein
MDSIGQPGFDSKKLSWVRICVRKTSQNTPLSEKIKKCGKSYFTISVGYNNLRKLGN